MRGKCRHCGSSVFAAGYGWASENGSPEPYECVVAPPAPCPPCSSLGKVLDERESQRAGYEVWARCSPCRGRGFVPGPHWPWRHPPTAL